MLYKLCRPVNPLRIALIVCMFIGFTGGAIALGWIGALSALQTRSIGLTIVFCIASIPVFVILTFVMRARKKVNKQ